MKTIQRKFATLTLRGFLLNVVLWLPAIAGYAYPLIKGSFSVVAFLN